MGYATQYNKYDYYNICDLNHIIRIDENINELSNIRNKLIFNPLDTKIATYDILDFASDSHVDNSISDPFSIFTQNASIPSKLLEWIGKDNWKNINVYYHISTDEIYSEIPLDKIKDKRNWFDINSPIKPNNPYSASKAAQDCFLMSLKHTYGLNIKFLRMANQQPGRYQHKEKMLMASILRCINGDSVKIYGNGENVRQWTPVEITSIIILDILKNNISIDDEVIHIANCKGLYTNNQIIEMLEDIMALYGYTLRKEYINDRKGHDTAYALITKPFIDKYFDNCDVKDYMKTCIDYCFDNKDKFIL